MELDDAWVQLPWQHGGGEGAGRKKLRCYGNEMDGIENENEMHHHGWSFCLCGHDSALEGDSVVQIIKHHNSICELLSHNYSHIHFPLPLCNIMYMYMYMHIVHTMYMYICTCTCTVSL